MESNADIFLPILGDKEHDGTLAGRHTLIISGLVEDEWMGSEDTRTQCLRLHCSWIAYFQDENHSWKRDRQIGKRIHAKP